MKGIHYRSGTFCIAWAAARADIKPLLGTRCVVVAEYEREHQVAPYLALIECPGVLAASVQATRLRRNLMGDGTFSRPAACHFITSWLHGLQRTSVPA